jgi:hypothetical protein
MTCVGKNHASSDCSKFRLQLQKHILGGFMRVKIILSIFSLVTGLAAMTMPMGAQDQIHYISQPDELTVFLNDVVFVRDELRVPLDVETRIVLPQQIVQNTLIVRDEAGRLPLYSINRQTGQVILTIGGTADGAADDVRNLTLEYITLGGIRWQPRYDLHLETDNVESVAFDFFAEIQNDTFTLMETQVNLVAGRVDVSGQTPLDLFLNSNMTQGFSDIFATATPAPLVGTPPDVTASGEGEVTTQPVYEIPPLTSQPGETIYAELLETTFPARRVLVWNAYSDAQGIVVYKVRNTSEIALAEGIVRSYQAGLFAGSDEIEYTPPGGEGSVTVGPLRDARVRREVSQMAVSAQNPNDADGIETLWQVTLVLTSLTSGDQEIEVFDRFADEALNLEFQAPEPERQGGNMLRWLLTVPAGEEIRLRYAYRTPY